MAESNENEPGSTASPTEDILTVTQLNERIAEGIESSEELHGVRSIGEITDLSAGNSARYFTLTDGDCELRCVLWESRYQNMDIDLENGMEVVLEGNVDFWREGGEISLKPWEVTAVGEGEQAAAIDRLERELEQRGWFDDDHKQYPPRFPERVGVVTSLQGDARYDIQNAIHEQDPTVDILVKDATVQGPRAPRSIANGIHHFDRHEDVDVIIAGTGLLGAGMGASVSSPGMNPLVVGGVAVFGATTGAVAILAHIGADALTPMGVGPLGDDGPYISYEVCRADSTLGNYGLLALGGAAALLAFYLGRGVNAVLPM